MTNNEILEAATQTITLMTAFRMAAGMTADEAVKSATEAFLALCAEAGE